MVVRENITDFHPDHTFDSGQCFRWTKERDGSYNGIAFGMPVNIRFQPYEDEKSAGTLIIDNIDEEAYEQKWKPYLDLDTDYSAVKKLLSEKDEVLAKAIDYGHGIRILRQESWEALISFIVSQNNNITRIKKCIDGLCERFGEHAGEYRGKSYYSFPTAVRLAGLTEEDLAPIRLGYRAKYILETAKAVAGEKDPEACISEACHLNRMRQASTEEAYDYLTQLCGVGPKVANCILLYGMAKHESFPIDVWVKRVMNRLYGIEENDVKTMAEYAKQNFGEYGGIAQHYLFYYIRSI
ncbi:DNA-3-methyladenine glycosylase family protein [Clostridium aminobutyricum]|uniref:DNA-(apurinic or apyrimidinic site) lyase n=1 Tax=Clostridium aminobutyricum TaxID=33953 RepID=A0A939DAS3_CLOAM|nr:DNA glycosylase [Clostridium aminobutyricum]MBN7774306.1 8-oxoguanine DNA glycosylase [Clostridium aminobutyricum]